MRFPTKQARVPIAHARFQGACASLVLLFTSCALLLSPRVRTGARFDVLAQARAEGRESAETSPRATPGLERRILVLRASDAPHSASETRVDLALGQVLAEMGFIVNVSPMPFRDAQLALGCSGSLFECGGVVAATLESEQLAVSSLSDQEEGMARLELYLFAPGGQRADAAELPLESPTLLERRVRELARNVYGEVAPESRVAAEQQRSVEPTTPPVPVTPPPAASALSVVDRSPAQPVNSVLRAVGWSTATAGAALLLGAAALSIAADRSAEAYARQDIREKSDADEALASYARAEHQSHAARVLFGTGGAVLIAGTALLLWEHLIPERRHADLQIAAAPLWGGALVSMHYRAEGRGW
jgi:hypothetical protein